MTLRLNGSTSGYTAIDSDAVGNSTTFILPSAIPTADRQVLVGAANGTHSYQWDGGSFFYRLASGNDVVGADVNTAQSMFGVSVTLAASTVYLVDIVATLNKTAGATSHTIGLSFGGTATLTNIFYQLLGTAATVAYPSITVPTIFSTVATASNTVVTAAIASATANLRMLIRGTVSINAGGTFIPQYTLSAAPGGAYSTVAGSYIRLTPIGPSGANSSQGTWS